jgi:signal transduction histidine kinase/ActR/RegA family two-component response regulator
MEMSLNLIGQVTKNGSTCDISMIDITERKQAEEKLADVFNKLTISRQELEHSFQLNADKDLFISILAHDLRNPFSIILGYTELLLENVHNLEINEIENSLNEINKSAKSTFILLEDLLRWSRVRIGKFPFEPKKLKFTELCNEIISLLTPIAETKNITIEFHVDDKIRITADADMIKAVFRNLVSNAIKFTEHKGRIIISAEQTKSDIIFSVSDTGIGIAPENLTKLFEVSQDRTTTGTDNEKGSGFGLLICKDFVEKHGGRIWVESEYGKGSVFYFNIPRRPGIKTTDSGIKETDEIRKLKILIAEDNESLRIILGDMVKNYSKEILYAETGIQAVSIFRNNPDIDLILMDLYMPVLNGFEATKQIRQINKDVIIILETADEHSEITKKSLRKGINDYFFKPYNRTFLNELITKHFGANNRKLDV